MKSVIRTGMAAAALVCAAATALGCATTATAVPGLAPASKLETPSATDAVVVFVRPSAVGEGYAFPIRDESGEILAFSGARSQFALHLPPGERTLALEAHGSVDVLQAELAPGRTYFVTVVLRPSAAGPRWELVPLRRDELETKEVRATLARTPTYRVQSPVADRGTPLVDRNLLASNESTHVLRIGDGQ